MRYSGNQEAVLGPVEYALILTLMAQVAVASFILVIANQGVRLP
jgi:hypothetical protein